MADVLKINRPDRKTLTVRLIDGGGVSLSTSGGGNITPEEFDRIAAFVTEQRGADAFLGKLRARMAR